MGTGQRDPMSRNSFTPGPGNYNTASKDTQGPKYIMGMKGYDWSKINHYKPGPGQYLPDYKQSK